MRRPGPAGVLVVGMLALTLTACFGSGPTRHSRPRSTARPRRLVLRVRDAGFGLASPIQREVAVQSGGRLYLAGGLDAAGSSVGGVFALDPATGRLMALGSLPQPVHDAAGAVLGDRLLVFGGGASSSVDAVQAFDPANGRGDLIGHLPVPLSDLSAATVGRTVYLVGGFDDSAPRAEVYATADGTSFRRVASLPQGLRYAAVAAQGDRLIVAGGVSSAGPTDAIERIDPASGRVTRIGRLPVPVGHAAAFELGGTVFVAGGRDASDRAVRTVTAIDAGGRVTPAPSLRAGLADPGVTGDGRVAWLLGGWRRSTLQQVLRATLAPAPSSGSSAPSGASAASASGSDSTAAAARARPFGGLLVVADRGNDRLLVLNARKQVVWTYPSPGLPPPTERFYFPDDAFWVHGGRAILVNEEENDLLVEIAYPSGRTIWSYGHPGVPGATVGYLHQPDDLYPLPGGGVTVADAKNCRILFFDAGGQVSGQLGTAGACVHRLPTDVGYPNGDTPLANGDLLLSELRGGGYVDEVTRDGRVIWSHRLPGVRLPSDPQRLPDGTFLVVDYETPGRIVRFTADGRVLWSYGPAGGPGELHNPSLGAPLPNGLVAVNDDFAHRVVIIDPATDRIVWQYGRTGVPGTGPGLLDLPDGVDLLLPGGVVPLHVDFADPAVVPGRP